MAAPLKCFRSTFTSYCRVRNAYWRIKSQNIAIFTNRSIRRNVSSSTNDDFMDGASSRQIPYDELYEGHIPTSRLQKAALAVGSAAMSLYNPARDDMISSLGETTGIKALKYIRQRMLQDPIGQQILEEKPLINTVTVDVEYLGSLPENTFGKAYWNFLSKNGFTPDARHAVNFVDDVELMYVMLRYRQVHDLMHSLLSMPPNMLGEVVVKWVEAIQTGLPMCALAAVFGPLRLGPRHKQMYVSSYLPWALHCGFNSKFLMSVYFEKHWDRDLDELRKELNIERPPKLMKK